MSNLLSRRMFLHSAALGAVGVLVAACQPEIVEVTKIVEKPVEKVVKETVIVEAGSQVVEKLVTVQPAIKQDVTMTWAYWGDVTQVKAQSVKTGPFRAKHPNVNLQPWYVGWSEYPSKLLTAFAGGAAPDIMKCDAYWALDWAKRGVASPLEPFFEKDAEAKKDDWLESFNADMTLDGKLHGLPSDAGPRIWIYNVQIIEESGKPSPMEYYAQDNWTWEAFQELGRAVTDEAKKQHWLSFDSTSWLEWMMTAWSFGGEYFDANETKCLIDSEPFVKAIQFWADLILKDNIVLTQSVGKELGVGFHTGNEGIRGMWPNGTYSASNALGGEQMVQPWYTNAGSAGRKCVTKSNCFMICSQTEQPDLAFDLIKGLCGPEGEMLEQALYHSIFPATRQNYEDPAFWEYGKRWDLETIHKTSVTESGHRLPITAKVPWSQMQSLWTETTDEVWIGKTTVKECVKTIADEVNKMLSAAE